MPSVRVLLHTPDRYRGNVLQISAVLLSMRAVFFMAEENASFRAIVHSRRDNCCAGELRMGMKRKERIKKKKERVTSLYGFYIVA